MCLTFLDALPPARPEEVESEIKEVIRFHLDGMRQDGAPIPKPSAVCEYVEA